MSLSTFDTPEEEARYKEALRVLNQSPEEREAERKARQDLDPTRIRANFEAGRCRETAKQREARLIRENLQAWCEHHLRQEQAHGDLAKKHREEYEKKRTMLERGAYVSP